MRWAEFERAAPHLARQGRERFERTRVALIATLRTDGSPRISPVEPVFAMGQLLLGVMRSAKAMDLERDPRCALHSSVSDVNGSEGEFKLHGRAVPADASIQKGDYEAWWKQFPGRATVLELDFHSASLVTWDTKRGLLELTRWSTSRGVSVEVRSYP